MSTNVSNILLNWVEALRSGKYTQITHSLYRNAIGGKCFCAAGVLLDISKKGDWGHDGLYIFNNGNRAVGYLSGSDIIDVFDGYCEQLSQLVFNVETMNDLQGRSFAEIADKIEEEASAENLI